MPVAFGAKGQPPSPPTEASSALGAGSERGVRVRVAGVARVVEVAADGLAEPDESLDERFDLRRRRNPDRVREDELVRLRRRQPLTDRQHALRIHRALERATEGDRDCHAGVEPVLFRALDDALGVLQRGLDRRSRVAFRERLRGGDRE